LTSDPGPIAGLGYHEVFRDDFNTLDRSVWDNHIWYDDPPVTSWSGFQTVDSSGILHLRTARTFLYPGCSSNCYPINTLTTQSSGRTWTQGYFEARMRWTGGAGAWPGFWLFSYRHATNPSWPSLNPYCSQNALPSALCYSAELDVFEGQGTEPQSFYGTIHRNSSNDYGVSDRQNSNNWQPGGVDLTSGFHTYGMLWTASTISWYLDGRLLMSAPNYDSTNQPMFLLLQMWVGGWTADPGPTTPDVLDTQVDYVSVWQR
jgi:beta-glucanase (GH16 family)